MSKKNKKNKTLETMTKPVNDLLGHNPTRQVPESQDGFPLRYASTGDPEEVQAMVARLREERKKAENSETVTQ